MIAIVDYGMGNLRSVQKAFEFLGFPAETTDDPARLKRAERVVLPGVGAFRDAAARLRETGLDRAVLDVAESGRPLLGICLGMQLLFARSEENGSYAGLALLPGTVERLPDRGLKIPHMGWNTLRTRACPLFPAGEDPCVYFVHSYAVLEVSAAWTCAVCEYGVPFTAAACRGNVMATQFHPEKSGSAGLAMLRRFALYAPGEEKAC